MARNLRCVINVYDGCSLTLKTRLHIHSLIINIYVSYYFKGPEFVRKHILNKHGDKIEEVKKEVTFFNNFLMDAKRPAMPEMKLPPLPGPTPGTRSFLTLSDPVGREKGSWLFTDEFVLWITNILTLR